jgi:SAM-dependent methyltransferase
MGLLIRKDDHFSCTRNAAEFLSRHSPRYLGHIILHHQQLMDSWAHLDEAVQSGRPVRQRYAGDDPEWRRNFLLGMFDLAMILAPKLVGKIDLSGRRRLLDLGGGPGTWAIHFCRENPGLEATVYDLPTTRAFAEETIARFDLKDRVAFVAGDFLEEELTGRYDVAWLSHILHGEGPREVRTILDKALSVLEPGGLLLIHEFILDDDRSGPLFPALFSLNMLLGTPAGRAYSGRQLFDLLRDAGFRDPRLLALGLPGESSVIAATV